MATRKAASASRDRRRKADSPAPPIYPRDKQGRFVPLAEYRPRDKKGRFLSAKKIPKALRDLIAKAKAEKLAAEAKAEAEAAARRSAQARKAALALAAKRRARLEALEAERVARAEEEARLAEEEARLQKKEEEKRKRKERRKKQDEEIRRLREQQAKLREEEERRKEEAAADRARAEAQAILDAEARAEEEMARREAELLEQMDMPVRPGPPVEDEKPEAAVQTGVVATPEEIMELGLLQMRAEAVQNGDLDLPETDPVLTRHPRSGSLGRVISIGRMIGEEGLADDLAEIAADVSEEIFAIDKGLVYAAIQLTEWGPAEGFVGSIDRVVSSGQTMTLVESWQSTTGKDAPKKLANAVRRLVNERLVRNPRAASMVEALHVKGFARHLVLPQP